MANSIAFEFCLVYQLPAPAKGERRVVSKSQTDFLGKRDECLPRVMPRFFLGVHSKALSVLISLLEWTVLERVSQVFILKGLRIGEKCAHLVTARDSEQLRKLALSD